MWPRYPTSIAHLKLRSTSCETLLRKALTITELVEAYIDNYAKLKKRSWKQDESFLKRLLIPALGTRLAMTVTTADIQQIHTAQGATYPASANNFLIVVRKLFNWAPTAGHLPKGYTNPVVGARRIVIGVC